MIKAALFDVYGTCVDWHSGMRTAAEQMLTDKGLDIGLGRKIAEGWRRQYQPSMERVRCGRDAYRPLDAIQIQTLDIVLDDLAIAHLFDAGDRAVLNAAWDALPAWPDTTDALRRLRTAMPIAACSNGSKSMMARLAAHAGLPWTMIGGADLAQTFKPEPTVYLKSCAALGFAPNETVMVACHDDDLDAAAACGLATAHVPRPAEWGADAPPAATDAGRFTFRADTLTELIDRIVRAAA
ncbi:MAG: haloacid dehalogenase type II [Roseitalea sp.]|jgi:2-haloacid dehalogenase|nr:haloacid dehalogenase type II [Roseitalea sp.]MBO6721273.1 haloacid dehalogenase type II [Roseitalea sp.]MBO6742243.1 haloacid dehalogenase type II [Roseitalea sp.]